MLISGKAAKLMRNRKEIIARSLLEWGKNTRLSYPWRETCNPYHILIAETLLRKTRADQAASVYVRFITRYPSVELLSSADLNEVRALTYPLGMHSRAKWILNTAQKLAKEFDCRIPSNNTQLEQAIGRGRKYTINALRCFAFGEKVAIFDVNVKRILERLFSLEFGKNAHKNSSGLEVASLILPEEEIKEYNWALLDLGRNICTARNPKCNLCPLRRICDYAMMNDQSNAP